MNNRLSYTRDSSQTNNAHMFKGSEHKQMLMTQYTIKFMCDFDMRWYPFDTQLCYMNVSLEGNLDIFVNLSTQTVLDLS